MPSDVVTRLSEPSADLPAHALAVMVLTEMRRHGILPSPPNYELWFTFRTGTNPSLTERMRQVMMERVPVTPALLAALHAEFIASQAADPVAAASALRDLTDNVSDELARGQASARVYGDALAAMTRQLGEDPTVGSLIDAIATITAETSRAGERNRLLERQLAASTTRIDKLRKSLSEVREEATTDVLTGILNRRAFEARLRRLNAALRLDPGAVFSVLLLDVDHFKAFNDTHGHAAGDFVLRLIARLLTENVKGRDVVARYGGEEFAVLLVGTPLMAASVVARQIAEALGGKRLVSKASRQGLGAVTVSAGVAEARRGDSPAALMERADAALYQAKQGGRNQVRVDDMSL